MRTVFWFALATLAVIVTLNGAEAILTLAGLGFLGFGIEPTQAPVRHEDFLKVARPMVSPATHSMPERIYHHQQQQQQQ